MGAPQYRIWFGSRSATADELRRVEEVEVTQEMDAFWEARLRLVLCLDATGRWLHWPGDVSEPFSRVRIEVDNGSGRFTPLIDGPVVSIDAALDALPGRSTATLVVRDDSAFLNRDEDTEAPFEHLSDSDIATQLFSRFGQLQGQRVAATDAQPEFTTRRGSVLQFLRDLGLASDRHAYVLPGDQPGASIGCFLPDPEGPEGLPPLVMIGEGRNLANASISENPDGGERTRAVLLRVDDQGTTTVESSAAELGLMRDLPARPADLTPLRLVHPADNTRADPAPAARARARRHGYVYRLTSHVVPGCYGGVLVPYQKVRVDAGATPYSGDYLIKRVVHRITPSVYTQELEATTDSTTEVAAAQVAEALGGGVRLAVSSAGGLF